MAFDIRLSDDAKHDLRLLRVVDRRKVLDALDIHLRHEPAKESKSRIKRLRRMETPQYRLRVDAIRVYYDVVEGMVQIIAIVPKPEAAAWLAREGIRTAHDATSYGDEEHESENS